MVLVSNEWQNKCEDEPKTTANTATTAGIITTSNPAATTNTTTSTVTSTATNAVVSESIPEAVFNAIINTTNNKSETIAKDSTKSITISSTATTVPESTPPTTTAATTTIIKTLANDNVNNEHNKRTDKNSIEIAYNNKFNDDNNENKIAAEVGKLLTATKRKVDNLDDSLLNYNNNIKLMAENTKESPLKEAKEEEESQILINNYSDNNKDLDESNSYPNTNTNTLQAPTSMKVQQNIITQQQQQHQVQLSCPIIPQVLSSALQSALNSTNNANNSVAAAGLQPNFLSQLALTANVAGLQKPSVTTTTLTAKQLNQSFNMLDSNNPSKSDSNLIEAVMPTTTSSSTTTTTVATTVPTVSCDNGQAKIVLICEGNSHPFQTRTISLTPNIECMVGRLIAKSKASENNAIFDCKVLSRKHAVIWYTPEGKFWVKDTKSSNGTFINDNKLGDEEAELHFGDIVKFGVDVLENSRKEVHGCIIACVKLYLPDGREAISIDSSAHRSHYSGEGRISFDELHRLNLYIQETSQREKVLTSKLCNIQNVLDATRKNSALCWQSMITEDQLLHRIHSLEKKLQFMEKNVPENLLRNEILKLLDDKTSYQNTAKEALRKVYQERCDAMQMLAKMESAYTQSDNECSLLRDQIMNSKQTLQDVNSRLLRLETEYNEYKDEVARQQQDAKEREEQRIAELTEKLREHELECEELKRKISELLIKRADLLDDEEQLLEKQAMEKLDAAIADMDLGDDDDSDDEGEYDKEVAAEHNENKRNDSNEIEGRRLQEKDVIPTSYMKKLNSRPQLTSTFGGNINGVEEEELEKNISKLKKSKAIDSLKQKSPPKRVKETTIMKWLQNSDLNKNEGSFDIFKAICNENENDEEVDMMNEDKSKDIKPIKNYNFCGTNEFNQKYNNFTNKLKNVQKNLKQLEAEIDNDIKTKLCTNDDGAKVEQENMEDDSSDDDDEGEEGACADEEFIIKRNGKISILSGNNVLSKENKKYLLLKSSVNMLREAFNEICDSVNVQEDEQKEHDENEKSPPPNIKVKTQFQTYAKSPTITKKFESQTTLRFSESDITESDSEVESLTLSSPANISQCTTVVNVKTESAGDQMLLEKLKEYQTQVEALNEKLQQTELEAQHTLEIMQVECDDVKQKTENLNRVIEALKNDKIALEKIISENKSFVSKPDIKRETTFSTATKICNEVNDQLEKELELEEDPVLNAINVTALECEEELITYKERLDEQQRENIDLRNEIALLKLKANTGSTTKDVLLKQFLPYSFVILAIIVYFLTTYF